MEFKDIPLHIYVIQRYTITYICYSKFYCFKTILSVKYFSCNMDPILVHFVGQPIHEFYNSMELNILFPGIAVKNNTIFIFYFGNS